MSITPIHAVDVRRVVDLVDLASGTAALLFSQPLDPAVRGPYLAALRVELGQMLLDRIYGQAAEERATYRREDAGDLLAIVTARQIADLPGRLDPETLKVWLTSVHAELGRLMDSGFVHARGFPDWGPPTMCGAPGPVPNPCGEVTCPTCVTIVGDGATLAARAAAVEREHGPPRCGFALFETAGGPVRIGKVGQERSPR